MSALLYTPGPWSLVDRAGAGLEIYADVSQALGERFSKNCPIYGLGSVPAPRIQIAYETWVQFPRAEWDRMQRANGQLMATAPELLTSLDTLIEAIEFTPLGIRALNALGPARAARDKARGAA